MFSQIDDDTFQSIFDRVSTTKDCSSVKDFILLFLQVIEFLSFHLCFISSRNVCSKILLRMPMKMLLLPIADARPLRSCMTCGCSISFSKMQQTTVMMMTGDTVIGSQLCSSTKHLAKRNFNSSAFTNHFIRQRRDYKHAKSNDFITQMISNPSRSSGHI